MSRRVLVALAAALLGLAHAPARAQPVSANVSMSVDRAQVAVGETFQLRVEARCQGASNPDVRLPDLSEFEVLGRRVHTPFSMTFGFGGGSRQVQSTVRHLLTLRAVTPGRFELEPATVQLAGQRFESAPLTVEVTGTPGGPAGAAGADPGAPPPVGGSSPPPTLGDAADGVEYDPGGFVRVLVEPAAPFVGQQATVSVYLYVPAQLSGNPMITQEASTDGFWVQDLLPPSRRLEGERQVVRGRRFQVFVLRRFAAFPLSPGEQTIGPVEVTIERRSVFDLLGMGGQPSGPWVRRSPPVPLDIRPLPEDGRPDGPVHVGDLSLSAELDRAQVATGDAVTLTLTATGTGALEQLRIEDPERPGLRVLSPEIQDSMQTDDGVVRATRQLRWLIVPEEPGDYTLGPFEVATFDPATESYGVARAGPVELTAAGAAPRASAPAPADVPEDVDDDADRARFGPVRTRSALSRASHVLSEQSWFLGTLAVGPLALLLGAIVLVVRRRAAREDPTRAPRRARRAARRQLAEAAARIDAEEPRDFYAAIAAALKQVLESKLGEPVGSLTHPELRRALARRGMGEDLAERLVDELEGCDFARFSAVGVGEDEMRRCLERARGLIDELGRFSPRPAAEDA